MDSQEVSSNAAETPSIRGVTAVKPNPPPPSGFRARPQGPPGIPRHPINNGPIGQPRLAGQPQQIRFDNRSPVGPSGQFTQLRPYGTPRPPGGFFPQRPPNQGHNAPIVLNPRFTAPPGQRPGPPQGPRQLPPGNHQAPSQTFGNIQRPQLPNPYNPQQQPRKPEALARPGEITQKQLQRNESSLNIPRQGPPLSKEEKKLSPPRIIIDKMTDVDHSKKLQQCENVTSMKKSELRENADNDDDDDVVMDGKSPRTNGDAAKQDEGKDGTVPKRSETATINGKVCNKSEDRMQQAAGKTGDATGNLKNKETISDSGATETDARMCSKQSSENAHNQEMDKSDSKVEEPIKKKLDDHTTFKKSDSNSPKQSSNKLEITSSQENQETSKEPSKSPEKSSTPSPLKVNEDKTQVKTTEPLDKSPNKSLTSIVTKPGQNSNQPELSTPSKSSDGSRVSAPVETNQSQNEPKPEASKSPKKLQGSTDSAKDVTKDETKGDTAQKPKTSPVPPSEQPASSPAKIAQDKREQESKELPKPSDKPSTVALVEIHQNQDKKNSEGSHDTTSAEIDANKNEDELKIDTRQPGTQETSTPAKTIEDNKDTERFEEENESNVEPSETKAAAAKSEMKSIADSSKEMSQGGGEQEPKASPKKSEQRATPAEASESQNKLESKETAICEKSKMEVPLNAENFAKEKILTDVASKSSDTAMTNLAEKPETPDALENQSFDKIVENSSVSNAASSIKEEVNKVQKPTTLLENKGKIEQCTLSVRKSAEDVVKGFDNGEQRSLSVKSSLSQSPQSLASPKSPKSPVSPKSSKSPVSPKSSKSRSDNEGNKTSLKSPAPESQREPSLAELDDKSEKKSSTTPEIENGSVTNESLQSNAQPTTNGVADSPTKKSPTKGKDSDKRSTAGSPVKSPSKSVKSLPRTPETPTSTATAQEKKKVPMNKIQVGSAPSPNLKTVRSKIGSLENASYKPGGGKVKIENRKLDFSKAQPKIAAKNEKYTPSGGDKKIAQVKLQWNAKPKVGSLENATYKPGGGDKKIETVKLDFKDKAKPKVGSKDNAKHVPGGGGVKSSATPPKTPQDTNNDIQTQKIDIKAESKVGSMDNVKHKPGGGEKKIFNDRDYLRQTGSNVESLSGSGSQITNGEHMKSSIQQAKDVLPQPPPSTPTKAQRLPSPSSVVTPKAVRNSLAKSPDATGSRKNLASFENTDVDDENRKNLNVMDHDLIKDKTAKSPTSPRSPNKDQLKNTENKAAKLHSSQSSDNSETKNLENKAVKSPNSSRPLNNSQLKSPSKSPPQMSGKLSPRELRLPKLIPSPTPHDTTTIPDTRTNSKISLPKLIERVTH